MKMLRRTLCPGQIGVRDTSRMNTQQTPSFIREYESTLSAVHDEILREAPDCELVQLTDEVVIFGFFRGGDGSSASPRP